MKDSSTLPALPAKHESWCGKFARDITVKWSTAHVTHDFTPESPLYCTFMCMLHAAHDLRTTLKEPRT